MNETNALLGIGVCVAAYGSVLAVCGINGTVTAGVLALLGTIGGYIFGKKKATKER